MTVERLQNKEPALYLCDTVKMTENSHPVPRALLGVSQEQKQSVLGKSSSCD
jgi:hypothetical protein